MTGLFLLLVAASCALALVRWRWGLLAMILVGALQDPVRKMTPGAPGYLVLPAAMVWAMAVVGALLRGDVHWAGFRRYYPRLSRAILVFAVLLIPAAIRSATYSAGSWQVALIGTFIYGSLLLGMTLGAYYPQTGKDIRRLLAVYCIVMGLAAAGGLLEKIGWRHPSIGTEAMGHQWVTYRMGSTPVHMLAGFFRSPDVNGWHAAMLVMLSLILVVHTRGLTRWVWFAPATLGALDVLLCGRRKMIAMLPVFLLTYLFLHILHGRGRRLRWILASIIAICAAGVQVYRVIGIDETTMAFYGTAVDTAPNDLRRHGLDSVLATYRQAGFFGYGLGMATQGTHHVAANRPRVWQESGPSRLMVELGVPGFIGFALLGLALLRAMLLDLRWGATSSLYPVFAGFSAVLLANGTAGIVSAQIFGDPFVASFLSLLIGLVLSAARLHGSAAEAAIPARPQASPFPSHLNVTPPSAAEDLACASR